jgi:hypothetical protein
MTDKVAFLAHYRQDMPVGEKKHCGFPGENPTHSQKNLRQTNL